MLKTITGKVGGGTCFLVNRNYALTVSHCVKEKNIGDIISVTFPNLKLDIEVELVKKLELPLDFAILKLKKEAPELNFVPLVNDILLDEENISSYGFPIAHKTHGRKIKGEIIDSNLIMPEKDSGFDNYDLKIASSDINEVKTEFISGLSGSPLVVDNKIIGIVKNSLGDGFGVQKIGNFIEYLKEYRIEYEELSTFREKLIKKALNEVEENKKSGKYIKGVHIEINEIKDKIRHFCDPLLFYKQLVEKIERLDYSLLNSKLKSLNLPLMKFEIETKQCLNLYEINKNISQIDKLLFNNIEHFKKIRNEKITDIFQEIDMNIYKKISCHLRNMMFGNSSILENILKDTCFFKCQIMFILDTAGRGKTTLMCDFVENFLSNKKQLTLLIPAYKILSGDWITFLEREILKPQNIEFQPFLKKVNSIAEKDMKPALIIIDGLNENENHKELSINLLSFIEILKDYPYIKLILTSREEYFKERFKCLEEIRDRDNVSVIENVFNFHRNEILKETAISKYLKHFNVNTRIKSNEVENQLVESPLLLRFFCEAYREKTISDIYSLHKYDLFLKYTENKSDILKEKGYEIKCFYSILDEVSKYMLENNKYSEVPLEIFNNKELIKNIVIEDIVFREDLIIGQGRGGDITAEVISFTFDEYRDYNLAWYIIENNNPEEVYKKIINLIENLKPITEGVLRYIYFIAKHNKKSEILDKIERMVWTIEPFLEYIFSIEDKEITEKDMIELEDIFNYDMKYTNKVFKELLKRRNESFQTLNTNVIFDFITQMTTSDYIEKFLNIFKGNRERDFYYRERSEPLINQFINKIKEDILPLNQELAYKFLLVIVATPYRYDPYYDTVKLLEKLHKKLGDKAIDIIEKLKKNNKNQLLGLILERMGNQGELGSFHSYLSNFLKLEKEENSNVISIIINDMNSTINCNDSLDILKILESIKETYNIEEE